VTENRRTPIVEVTIAASFDVAWRALRDPAEIRRWHGWEYEEGGGLASEIDAIYGAGASASRCDGTIEFDGLDHRFEVEARGDETTLVRLTKPGPAAEETWDEIEQGWVSFVQQLRFFLERHRGRDRSTLMLAVAGGPAPTPEALEVEHAETVFATRFQTGLAVGAEGATLVVLHAPPGGGGRVIVSATAPTPRNTSMRCGTASLAPSASPGPMSKQPDRRS
jgi:hypothetical protein